MIRALAPVAALLFSVAILITGQGLQGTLLPVRANLENFPAFAIGLIGAAYFTGFTLGCIKSVGLIRKVGHIRVFAAMTAIASATPLLHSMVINEVFWCFLRFLSGFCFAALYVVIESWLNEKSTNDTRGTVFSAYVVIHLTVVAVGQQLLLFSDPSEMPLFAIVTVLVSLAAVPVALSTTSIPREVPDVQINLRRLYRISPAGVQGCLAAGISSGVFYSLTPLFTASVSSDISLAAWFMTAAVLGGATGQWPLGILSDRIDRRIVIAGAAGIGAGLSVLLWLLASSLSVRGLLGLGFAWGACAFPLYSVSVAHANDYANEDEFVMISGGTLLIYGSGAIAGPFIGALFIGMLGGTGYFLFIGGIYLLLALYLSYRTLKRDQAPEDHHIPFSEALAASINKSPVYDYQEVDDEPETPDTEPSGP